MAELNCDPDFLPLLDGFQLSVLQRDPGTIYGLWPDLRLAYTNSGWSQFAAENGGEPAISQNWGLGADITRAIAEPLRPCFQECYGQCLREDRPWVHMYECSTPAVYRAFQMKVFPLRRSAGLLVINSLKVVAAMQRPCEAPLEQRYRDGNGLILQCAHCRRVRPLDGQWDWVADWVKRPPPKTSHGICEVCVAYYFTIRRGRFDPPFSTDKRA